MRIMIVAVAALVAVARAAVAGSILYATAATNGGVDGFCLRGDGSIAPTPKVHVATAGALPRRLLVRRDAPGHQTLYVAEADRIEAFEIAPGGALKLLNATKPVASLDPRDLAFMPPDPTVPAENAYSGTLYATHHGYITAYRLEPDGSLARPPLPDGSLPPESLPTSCIQGRDGTNYLDLYVANGLLYASADDAPGRIEVYGLNCDGSVPPPVEDGTALGPQANCGQPPDSVSVPKQTNCGATTNSNRKASKWPYSQRTRIQKPKDFVVTGAPDARMIYVEERALRRIIAFHLQPDGTFCDRNERRTGDPGPPRPENCTDFNQLGKKKCMDVQSRIDVAKHPSRHQQCAASKTAGVLQYEGLVLDPDENVLIGAQFFKGRVDSYRLRPQPGLAGPPFPLAKLPKQPTKTSTQDPRMTPVRLIVDGNTVYVAAGELDRVIAYHLRGNKDRNPGTLAEKEPFSRTAEQKDSFPNDVAVAMLSAACE